MANMLDRAPYPTASDGGRATIQYADIQSDPGADSGLKSGSRSGLTHRQIETNDGGKARSDKLPVRGKGLSPVDEQIIIIPGMEHEQPHMTPHERQRAASELGLPLSSSEEEIRQAQRTVDEARKQARDQALISAIEKSQGLSNLSDVQKDIWIDKATHDPQFLRHVLGLNANATDSQVNQKLQQMEDMALQNQLHAPPNASRAEVNRAILDHQREENKEAARASEKERLNLPPDASPQEVERARVQETAKHYGELLDPSHPERNPYQVLHLPPDATREELKAAFEERVKEAVRARFGKGYPEDMSASQALMAVTAELRRLHTSAIPGDDYRSIPGKPTWEKVMEGLNALQAHFV